MKRYEGVDLVSRRISLLLLLGGVLATAAGCSGSAPQPPAVVDHSSPAAESDPIEQARVVLGEVYSYERVLTSTDAALSAAGEPVTDDSRSRAWSSILQTQAGLENRGFDSPDPMLVMDCIPDAVSERGASFTEAVAYCSLEVAGIPESQW